MSEKKTPSKVPPSPKRQAPKEPARKSTYDSPKPVRKIEKPSKPWPRE